MKTEFLKYHKSKRNKIKSFCYKLLNSSENISAHGRSFLTQWKKVYLKKRMEYLSKVVIFALKISHIMSTNRNRLIKKAIISLYSNKQRKQESLFKLKLLIYSKMKIYFTNFSEKRIRSLTQKKYNSFWKICNLIENVIRRKKNNYFKIFVSKFSKTWNMRIRAVNLMMEKYRFKHKYMALKFLRENALKEKLILQIKISKTENIVHVLAKMLQNTKNYAFLKMRLTKFKKIIRILYRAYEKKLKNTLSHTFFRWRSNIIVKKIEKKNLTNKFKGKILLSFSRNESNLDLRSSFLRWKIRSNKSLLKNTMDRLE